MAHLFTADWHLGHANIIKFCDRPFSTVEEMDEVIIKNACETVTDEDDLWVVGDISMSKATNAKRDRVAELVARVPGRKHLVVGNHDAKWIRDLPWSSIHDIVELEVDRRRVVLCHYPLITFPGARRRAVNLFGHVHNNWEGTRNSVNVGVDVWDFRPVSLSEIEDRANALPVNPLWDVLEPGCDLE